MRTAENNKTKSRLEPGLRMPTISTGRTSQGEWATNRPRIGHDANKSRCVGEVRGWSRLLRKASAFDYSFQSISPAIDFIGATSAGHCRRPLLI